MQKQRILLPFANRSRGSRSNQAANITLLRLCHTWTENARRPFVQGRRVVFAGIRFLCRAGPMCPAEKCVPGGGARGPRPTGQVRYPPVGDGVPQWSAAEQMPLGYDVPSARRCRAGRRIPTPVCALARNDSASRCLGGRSRPPLQVFIGDSRAGRRTPRAFVPLRSTAGRRFRRNNKTTRRHAPAGRSYPVDNFS